MIVQCECATFSKSLNPRNIDKSVSDIRVRIRLPFESSFWISLSGFKLTNLPDIQPANRIVIISETRTQNLRLNACFRKKFSKLITFLLKMRKSFEAEQPLLLIFCGAKFILYKSVCLLANFLFLGTGKFTFRKHCKIAIGIKACNSKLCFRFV